MKLIAACAAILLAACAPHRAYGPQSGVPVADVIAQSAAAGEQIQPGDRIVEADMRPVYSTSDIMGAFAEKRAQGQKILLLVYRGDRPRFAALDLSADSLGGLRMAEVAAPQPGPAIEAAQASGFDQSCIIASGNELRRLLRLEATGARSRLPAVNRPLGDFQTAREVEVDTVNTAIPVTYMFLCFIDRQGRAFASPVGRKST
jgi:hypothetical protein